MATGSRRPFCADVSSEGGEALAATASRIDHWILVEYRGVWAPHPLAGSGLTTRVKEHLETEVARLGRARLLFIRRPERRRASTLACFFGRTRETGSRFFSVELESADDLLDLDFGRDDAQLLDHPLLVVCTHGKRDRCCARYGRPLYDALRDVAEEDWVWQSTHVGGDRFAGNVVCLPEGLYFGRVGAADAWPLLDEYLAGRIAVDRYRGRCCYPFPVQAAEHAVRERTGRREIDALTLRRVERSGDERWRVVFTVGGEAHEVDVERTRGDLTYLTCSASELRRPVHYEAVAPA